VDAPAFGVTADDSAKLAGVLTLELVDLGTNGGDKGLGALKLGKNTAVESSGNSAINLGDRSSHLGAIDDDSGGSRSGGGGSSLGDSLGGLGNLGGLGSRSSGGSSSGSRSSNRNGGRSRLDHVICYTLMSKVFLSCF
jgi:hypothetical protein